MKISTSNAKRLINRFETATRNHEMIGAIHPDDWLDIQNKYEAAKKKLILFCIEAVCDEPTSQQLPVKGRRI